MDGCGNKHEDDPSSSGKATVAHTGALPSEGGQLAIFVFQILNVSGPRMTMEVGNGTNEKMKE